MAVEKTELRLRIVIDDPVPGVALAVQSGKTGAATLLSPTKATAKATVFDVAIAASRADDGGVRLLGPIVQGPPAARFLYIGVGQYAGQAGTTWARRIKFPLDGITWTMVERLKPGQRLTAHIHGRDKKGDPACASVKLTEAWKAS